jgi:membrane protein DedA with SNARE-associated domain
MTEAVLTFIDIVAAMPPFFRFLILCLSSIIEYIFPIFPGDTIVLLAGIVQARGAAEIIEVFTAIILGNIIGSCLGYYVGTLLIADKIKYVWFKKIINSAKVAQFNQWFSRYGYFLIFINRFLPAVRAFIFFAAGFCRLPFFLVLVLGALSSLLFNSLIFSLGYLIGIHIDRLLTLLQNYGFIVTIIIVLIILIYILIANNNKKSTEN